MREVHDERPAVPPVVLCVPGPWADEGELHQLFSSRDRYVLEGTTLTGRVAEQPIKLDVRPRDARIPQAFAAGSRRHLDAVDRRTLDQHGVVVYLVGRGGSTAAASALVEAAEELVNLGGMGVKIESSGTAHMAAPWLALAALLRENVDALHEAFVSLLGGGARFYSVGMHAMGFRDSIVAGHYPPREAASLLTLFNVNCLRYRPQLENGQIIGAGDANRPFRLILEPCTTFSPGDLFHNPFGLWRLEPVRLGLDEDP